MFAFCLVLSEESLVYWLREWNLRNAHEDGATLLSSWKSENKRLRGEFPIQANGVESEQPEHLACPKHRNEERKPLNVCSRYVINLLARNRFCRDDSWP
jgi:hypothetical protein